MAVALMAMERVCLYCGVSPKSGDDFMEINQRSLIGWCLGGLLAMAGWAGDAMSQEEEMVAPGNQLVVEGIPAVPKRLKEQLRPYTESRAAAFFAWHPSLRQMLIGTRFGQTNQIHHLAMPMGARTQWTFFDEPVAGAQYEPNDGGFVLFSRDVGGNEFAQLFRLDPKKGTSRMLSPGGRTQIGQPLWNRAKSQFVYTSTERNGADRDFWWMDPYAENEPKRMLLANEGGGWGILDWSPDDTKLLVVERKSVNQSQLYEIDLATAQRRPLTDPNAPPAAYLGGQYLPGGGEVICASDRQGEFLELVKIDVVTGKETPIGEAKDGDVESLTLHEDGKNLAFVVNEDGVSRLFLHELTTGRQRVIEGLPQGVISLGDWHRQMPELALTINSAKSPSDLFSVDALDGSVTRWTQSELGGISAESLTEPDLVRWEGHDGLALTGFLYRPPASFEGKRPVIISIHGGPEGQSRPIFQARNNFYLNELGVAIVYPNVRGSVGYGKTFTQLDNGMKRLDSVRDIGSLLDWVAGQPNLDANRIMVTGGSYGGYMTLATATQYNNRIRCALDVVGISHFGTFLKNTESYRRDLRRVEYGDERDPEMAKFFDQMAPLNRASQITKPLFIVQGGNDPRVPRSEAEQMVAKVRANGGPIWYLMAKDEGHGFKKKANADYQFYATVLFIEQYLLAP
ncbi:MAG: S9 family peptidase [Pirellulaceae bacterium]